MTEAAPDRAGPEDARRRGVYLLWIPLGAGSRLPIVRWNGRAYEEICARRAHRPRQALYHAALELEAGDEGRYVVEMTPAWGPAHVGRGTVASGPVGGSWLGRSRFFRYEVHCWQGGVIPDADHAVGGPRRLATDAGAARRIVELAPSVPRHVWGRDEAGAGEMWNSNSLIAWLLSKAGLPTVGLRPPDGGRAPGWGAGLAVAAGG